MFKGISASKTRGFIPKKDNLGRGFLFSPLLLIPLFLVIISGLLIKSIQEDFSVSNYSSHILTGLLGYFLAFFGNLRKSSEHAAPGWAGGGGFMSCRTAADLSRHLGDPHRTAFLLGSVDYSIILGSSREPL